MKYLYSILCISLLSFGCASKKIEDLSTTNMERITFSFGGGFAGKYTTYTLLENGQIFKNTKNYSTGDGYGTIPDKVIKQIFDNYTFLGLDKLKQESYGNMTYTLVRSGEVGDQKLSWTEGQAISKEMDTFFNMAMAAIKKYKTDEPTFQAPVKTSDKFKEKKPTAVK